MSEKKGKIVACDRCGETTFVNLVGVDFLDGGFSHSDKFENLPKGWGYFPGFGSLCPACRSKAEKLVNDFMKGQ